MAWAPDYVTSAQLKAYVRIGDAVDDAQIALAITAGARAIDRNTNRQFGLATAAEVRYYTAKWSARREVWKVPIDDLMTSVGLVVAVDTDGSGAFAGTITAPVLEPRNAAAKGRPWESLSIPSTETNQPDGTVDGVKVTLRPGWTTVPVSVEQANLLQASRFLARRDAPFGVAGSPDAGSELRLLAKVDPDVAVILTDYRRPRLGVG